MRIFVLISFLLLATGCKVFQPTVHTSNETVREYFRDTTIVVPGTDVNVILDSATLASIKNRLAAGEKKVDYTDAKSNAKISITQDANGNLRINCESMEQKFNFLLKEIQRLKLEQKTVTNTVAKTPWYMWVAIGAMTLLLITNILRK